MCGIVGYIGNKNASKILLDGLEKLEYRGYDSAGLALSNEGSLNVIKASGKLVNLREKVETEKPFANIGIGHTRWATHGAPTVQNAHPHINGAGDIAVVHNGIIENYEQLRSFLKGEGYVFVSETDTEVIAHLVDYYYNGSLMEAVKCACKKLEGSYALGVVSAREKDKLIAAKHESPLIAGIGKGENFIASDIPAILSETRDVYLLEDNEFAEITKDSITITDMDGNVVDKQIYVVGFTAEAAQKGGYDHFMIKEIHEQAEAVKNTVRGRFNEDNNIVFEKLTHDVIRNTEKIYMVACGTAYHASLIGKKAIEKMAKIPVEAEPASEFRYRNPLITDKTLVIIISQSGETADTMAALRMAKAAGAKTVAITNVVGSSAAREADFVFYTNAGPEIAVASTKAYTTQLVAIFLFAMFAAEACGSFDKSELDALKTELLNLHKKVEEVTGLEEDIKKLAKKIYKAHDVYFIGRGQDYPGAQEAALKLKEVSYIHADAYFGGELKHGPIALIENGTVVIALATDESIYSKTDSNIKEVTARGAYTIGVIGGDNKATDSCAENVVLPESNSLFAPIISIIPMQMLAYYVAVARGCDVDKPRNLAKSVTVE